MPVRSRVASSGWFPIESFGTGRAGGREDAVSQAAAAAGGEAGGEETEEHDDGAGQRTRVGEGDGEGIADRALADRIKAHYEMRMQKLVAALRSVGATAEMPGGTFYLYLPAPKGAGRKPALNKVFFISFNGAILRCFTRA